MASMHRRPAAESPPTPASPAPSAIMADHSLEVQLDAQSQLLVIRGGDDGEGNVTVRTKGETIEFRLGQQLQGFQIIALWIRKDEAWECPPVEPMRKMPAQFQLQPQLPTSDPCTLTDALDDKVETTYHYVVGVTNPTSGETFWTDPRIVNQPQ